MMLSFGRANSFARALEDTRDSDAESLGDSELARLVTLARAMPASEVTMTADSRDRIRRRLVAMAAVQRPLAPSQPAAWRQSPARRPQRRAAVSAGVLAALLAVLGFGSAARNALPGDPLYRLKAVAESAQLATTSGKMARGERHFSFASLRLTEAQRLLERGNARALVGSSPRPGLSVAAAAATRTPPAVWTALGEMSDHTIAGTKDLTEAWKASGDLRPLNLLTTHTTKAWPLLSTTIGSLPEHDQYSALSSLHVLQAATSRAETLKKINVTCDVACRSGKAAKTGEVAIIVDALGAVPCTSSAACSHPARDVAESVRVAAPVEIGPMATKMEADLKTMIARMPVISSPRPKPLQSLPTLPPPGAVPIRLTTPAPIVSAPPTPALPSPTSEPANEPAPARTAKPATSESASPGPTSSGSHSSGPHSSGPGASEPAASGAATSASSSHTRSRRSRPSVAPTPTPTPTATGSRSASSSSVGDAPSAEATAGLSAAPADLAMSVDSSASATSPALSPTPTRSPLASPSVLGSS